MGAVVTSQDSAITCARRFCSTSSSLSSMKGHVRCNKVHCRDSLAGTSDRYQALC